jgi:hypothetical protein
MSKTLITISEGNLLRVAATKSITTLTALKEKTSVDRKTLRAINAGQPVKETTLQSIADKLRVPLAHLCGPTTDKSDDVSGVDLVGFDGCRLREIKLKQLDGTALRSLAGETDQISWSLKIDQISEELEALLLKLRKSLKGLFFHILTVEDPGMDDLENQISQIKTSAGIDEMVEELAQKKMKIYGGTYVFWARRWWEGPDPTANSLPGLSYTSNRIVALCIAPEEKNISTVRVTTGSEPPESFVESELADIHFVQVDGRTVWSRWGPTDDEIPF